MAFKKTNRKAQAAIEFLMTYGWMLLVVLIVGALIFSFVDFGGLLPNQITFSSANIQPIVGDSFVTGTGTILVAFSYNGAQPIEFEHNSSGQHNVTYNFGDSSCTDVRVIRNNDLTGAAAEVSVAGNDIRFRNGHAGFIEFQNCPDMNALDVVEGEIKLTFSSTQTGAVTPVFGDIRLTKVE
ncbi:MAG: hypothetical protein VXZ40_00965 [Nanoarchaeota archaeon]|nr:hypothetical protein [Nanoarchaeota archaeon]